MIRILLLSAALLAGPAAAAGLTRLDPVGSRIDFTYTQMGVNLEGHFGVFSGRVAFDPARPQAATANVEIKLASVDTGVDEANGELAGPDWFDSRRFPLARFDSSSVQALGGGRYRADGQLTIKGRSRPVSVPFTYASVPGGAMFTGTFTLHRADFAIGERAWSDFGVVGNDVAVRFKLHLVP